MNLEDQVANSLQEASLALQALIDNSESQKRIVAASKQLVRSFQARGKVISCGNGGSHCDAMHFAEELSGRFRSERSALAAVAISDPAHITCTGNDYGFEEIFSRFIEAHGRSEDTLLAISTSGTSRNILRAVEVAKGLGMSVIGLTGKVDSPLDQAADISICTPGGHYADRVQELHIKVIHILIELVERQLYPEIY